MTTLTTIYVVEPEAGSLTATGETPIFGNQTVVPGAGALAAGTHEPDIENSGVIKIGAGSATLSSQAPTVTATSLSGAAVSFEALIGLSGDSTHGESRGELEPLETSITASLVTPYYAYAISDLAPLLGDGYMLTGGVGGVDEEPFLAMLGLSGDYPYGGSHLPPGLRPGGDGTFILGEAGSYLSPLTSYSYDPPVATVDNGDGTFTHTAFISEILYVQHPMALATTYNVAAAATVNITPSMTRTALMSGDISVEIEANASLDALSIYLISMEDMIQVQSNLGQDEAYIAWVMNRNNEANSRYDDYNLDSLVRWRGRFFGAGADGIFELTGDDDDDGSPIVSSVLLGKTDFDTSEFKRIESIYSGVQCTGEMRVTLTTDDGERYSYDMAASEDLATRRVVPGKGLRSRYYEVEYSNPDGEDFTLESTEINPAVTKRRL